MHIAFPERTVLITGAAHGFGRAMCLAFAERGAVVWGCDVLADALEETQRLCAEGGGVCRVGVVDIRDHAAIADFAASAGAVDILINNAGGVLGQTGQPMEQVTPQQWADILAVNLTGAFWFAQAVVPGMKQRRWGRIINISSGAGLNISLTGIQAYATAKAGLIHLTRQLAHELGPFNITVNSIAPGFVLSNPNTQRQWDSYGEAGQQRLIENIALRRLGTPQDIAYGALFLSSDFAGWITGQVLPIDGGK